MSKSRLTFHFQPRLTEQVESEPIPLDGSAPMEVLHSAERATARRVSWTKIFLTVSSAIASGVLIGMLILSLFTESRGGETVVSDHAASPANETISMEPNFVVPQQSLFVLQTGVFSSEQAAQQFQRDLQQQVTYAVDSVYERVADKFHVYAGIATDKGMTESLRQRLQFTSETAIIKPFQLQEFTVERSQSGQLLLAQSIQSARGVLAHLLSQEPPNPTDMTALHRNWSLIAQKAQHAAVQFSTQEEFHQLNRSLNQAYLAWLEWSKNPHDEHYQTVQGALLEYAMAEQKFMNRFSEHIK